MTDFLIGFRRWRREPLGWTKGSGLALGTLLGLFIAGLTALGAAAYLSADDASSKATDAAADAHGLAARADRSDAEIRRIARPTADAIRRDLNRRLRLLTRDQARGIVDKVFARSGADGRKALLILRGQAPRGHRRQRRSPEAGVRHPRQHARRQRGGGGGGGGGGNQPDPLQGVRRTVCGTLQLPILCP